MPDGGVSINPEPEAEITEDVSLDAGVLIEPEDVSTEEEEVEETPEGSEDEDDASDEESEEDDSDESLPFTSDEMAAFSKEVDENGSLSEKSYEDIMSRMNVSKDLIDEYIAGRQALQASTANEFVEMAGGSEQWQTMRAWAEENIAPVQLQQYTKMIESKDAGQIQTAIVSIRAQYENGQRDLSKPKPVKGKGKSKPDVFASEADWLDAMRDPRYKTDPNYRSKVESKFQRSF